MSAREDELHRVAIKAIKLLSKYEHETAMKLLDRITPTGEINDSLDEVGGEERSLHRHDDQEAPRGLDHHQSPSGCRFTTRVRLRIVKRPAGFSATTSLNTGRAYASCRQIASVS